MLRSLLVAATAAAVLAAPAGATPPANDDFAGAAALAGDPGTVTGSTIDATKEPDEPEHAGDSGGHSVWYRWTASRDGLAAFETCGSGFDTLLAVYTGAALATLAEVDANDDTCGTGSRVVFPATAGTTYSVAVDGWGGEAGALMLSWTLDALAPANTTRPVLSGAAVEGELLSVTTGTWVRAESFSYRWQRCGGAPTNVAHGRLVLASSAHDDHPEAHAVDGNWFTYWSSGMFPPAWIEVELGGSYPVDTVRAGVTMLPNGPTSHTAYGRVAGTAHEYHRLGAWSDSTVDQQWLEFPGSESPELESVLVESTVSPSWIGWRELEVMSSCTEIRGADTAAYRLSEADAGLTVRAIVRAENGGGARSAASQGAVVKTRAPQNLEPPLVTGSPEVGLMLTTTTGRWSGKEPIAYGLQWQSCDLTLASCYAIAGANQSSYFPLRFDIGSRVRVAVTATDAGGTTTAFSEATAPVRGPFVPVRCTVPRLRGKTLAQARSALRRSHCRLGAVRRKPSAAVRRGRVLAQRPAAGTRRPAGTRVEVVVSRGRRR
jgi:hypothetical protein